MAGPLEQFEIKPIVPIEVAGVDVSFTNSSLWMVFAAVTVTALFMLGTQRRLLIPNRIQMISEIFYNAVAGMVRDNVGSGGRPYFPFIFTLFMFILAGNLLGMIPHSFTFTSHLAVTFAMAAFIFVAVTIIGFIKQGPGFLGMFVPGGAPGWTLPLIVPIELVSYLSRPISLSVRLFANMTVGHTILKIVAGGVVAMGVFGIFPLAFLVAVVALEFLIAVIQAYVFAVLSCIYLNDALHAHH